jgi:hypothetical protein
MASQARFHEKNRDLAVHEILFHIHQMAVRGYIDPYSIISSGERDPQPGQGQNAEPISLTGAKKHWGHSKGLGAGPTPHSW